jgi:hypothetical protein
MIRSLGVATLAAIGTVAGLVTLVGPHASCASNSAHAFTEQDEDDDEEAIAIDKLPEVVKAAAMKYFGKLDGCKAMVEKDEGQTLYEINGKVNGLALSVLCAANGMVSEVEREVAADKLPPEVRSAIQKTMPGATLATAEEIEEHAFEITVTGKDGKKAHVTVSVGGYIEEHGKNGEEEGEEDEGHAGKH